MRFIIFSLILPIIIFAKVSLDDMVGQMIMLGFSGEKITDKWANRLRLDLKSGRVGSLVIFPGNIFSKNQLKRLLSDFKGVKTPLKVLIASIQEGGKNSMFSKEKGFEVFLDAKEVGDTLSLDEVKIIYSKMSKELKELGFNLNLAPVANTFLEKRSFSKYPSILSTYDLEFISSFAKNDIISCMKYFPHANLKASPQKQWDFEDLRPFYDAIKSKKIKTIMVSHARVDYFDKKYPASMSKKILHDILRKELKYDGLIISDDLLSDDLDGFSFEQRIIKSINAGVDILFFSSYFAQNTNTPKAFADLILKAIRSGEISEERIKQSYHRIKKLKEGLK